MPRKEEGRKPFLWHTIGLYFSAVVKEHSACFVLTKLLMKELCILNAAGHGGGNAKSIRGVEANQKLDRGNKALVTPSFHCCKCRSPRTHPPPLCCCQSGMGANRESSHKSVLAQVGNIELGIPVRMLRKNAEKESDTGACVAAIFLKSSRIWNCCTHF